METISPPPETKAVPLMTKSEALTLMACKMDRLMGRRPAMIPNLESLLTCLAFQESEFKDAPWMSLMPPDATQRVIMSQGNDIIKHIFSRCTDWNIPLSKYGVLSVALNCTSINQADIRLAYAMMTMEYFRSYRKGVVSVPTIYGVTEMCLTTMSNPRKLSVPSKAVLEEMQEYCHGLTFQKEDSNGRLFAAIRPKDFVIASQAVRVFGISQ